MIICNFKLNKKAIFKTVLGIMTIICISIGIAGIYNVLNSMEQKDNNFVNDSIPSSEVATLTAENYTNILKEVHDDIDTYVGQKISFSGYVYRVSFLCSSEKAKDYKTYSWVNITGEITKGSYNNSYIPILKITAIEETNKPENANVTLPDDEYVPTAVIY